MLGFAVIDVETSGLDAAQDRIVEVAVVRTDTDGRPIDEWTTLLNPGGPVGATSVHGIATADVRGAPQFADVVGELNARLAGRAVVAHNALFDLAFLHAEYARTGWTLPPVPYLCTLEASSLYLPDLDRRRLQDCCWALRLAHQDTHSALGDARAAASVLACYLAAARHLQPRPLHPALAGQATQVRWPPIPIRPFTVATRPTGRAQDPPAPAGTLWILLDDLPLSSPVEHGAPNQATAYLELLFEVLEDGVLTGDEARALVKVAGTYALNREQVQAAHRGFLLALAHRIIEDGKVTRDERALLTGAATALGVDAALPSRVLEQARTARDQHRSADCRPLPAAWSHGESLRVGQPVVFTGCDPIERAQLEGRAIAAGLRVTGSVTAKTATLVTDGANPNTVKARRAPCPRPPSSDFAWQCSACSTASRCA